MAKIPNIYNNKWNNFPFIVIIDNLIVNNHFLRKTLLVLRLGQYLCQKQYKRSLYATDRIFVCETNKDQRVYAPFWTQL